jgi:four helix bundle protein
MSFDAFDLSIKMVRSLRQPLKQVQAFDASLATQIRKAAASVPLNLNEGRRRVGGDRHHLWRIAAGSADEVRACLLVAEAWGYLQADALAEPLALLDRVLAMSWRLTH